MKMKTSMNKLFLVFLSLVSLARIMQAVDGFISVPAADFVLNPWHQSRTTLSIQEWYRQIPIAGSARETTCARDGQGLFNELVHIIEECGEEVYIEIDTNFSLKDDVICNKVWTLKSNITTFAQLQQKGIDASIIPDGVSFKSKSMAYDPEKIVILAFPFFDTITQKTFSAGTRFVRYKEYDTENCYGVTCYNPETQSTYCMLIDRDLIMVQPEIPALAKQKMVELLNSWVNAAVGIIPYVWGGHSFISLVAKDKFILKNEIHDGKMISFYEREGIMQYPFSGFDCSGLVLRAAQICNIPYFFANTTTLSKKLRPLQHNESLENGDLIWYQGHVMIVSSIEENEIIEAAGYPSGYGKLHRINLVDRWANINSYDELLSAYFNRMALQNITAYGEKREIPLFLILKFPSI